MKDSEKNIDDKIDEWHNSDSDLPLYQYLGMTKEKYVSWVKSEMDKDTIIIKLEALDPTGIPFKTNSLEIELEPIDSMRDERLLLTVGDYQYKLNTDGYITEKNKLNRK